MSRAAGRRPVSYILVDRPPAGADASAARPRGRTLPVVSDDRDTGSATDERDALLFFLDRLRDGLVRTSDGLSDEQLRAPGVPSGTNLLGLLQHVTAMEALWFQGVFAGDAPRVDSSMQVAPGVTRERVVAGYRDACARSDRIVQACPDLSVLSRGDARLPASTDRDARHDEIRRVSLRRILAHMIEETARHAGHADILRERIDGATDL